MMKKIMGSIGAGGILLVSLIVLIVLSFASVTEEDETGSSSSGSGQALVEVALQEDGTVGGKKYWDFAYSGMEYVDGDATPWCGAFVTWCADQIGVYPDIIPHTGLCQSGMEWFKEKGQWKDNSYTPSAGDLVYFDFNGDGRTEHVGIVQFAEGEDKIVTIEGNTDASGSTTGNAVAQKVRSRSSILGFGIPAYPALSPDLKGDTVEEQAYNYFRDSGYSKAAACGILANARAESGVNPASIQGGGAGPAAGAFQWENYNTMSGRFRTLYDRAVEQGKDWTDLKIQLDFVTWELQGGDPTTKSLMDRNYGGLENFKRADSAAWATEAFEKCFERAGRPNMEKRLQYAEEYMQMFD
ncbi:MAG TPA: CHAP domain-containing protein [Candidatus Mediterraneibacter norfolkensis]|nr:CHAP domain-containing protein [Candidatus Mediterraneibacter norfolkensis]